MLCALKVSCVMKKLLFCLTSILLLNAAFCNEKPQYFGQSFNGNMYKRTSLRECYNARKPQDATVFAGLPEGGVKYRVYPGEFQHMAAIGWTRSERNIDYLCGGSLISRKFVITAAHCNADEDNIGPDTVRLGDTDLESPEDDELAQQIKIARFITHPQYVGYRNYYDTAIIELQNKAQFSRAVCSACLWREEDVPREKMDAIGFGAIGYGEALSPTLQRIELAALDENDCARRIPVNRRLRPDGLRKDQFCAAGTAVDTCEGDSGSPIGVKRFDAEGLVYNFVFGIASFGTPCTVGSTGVYTKVSAFMDWIEQVTNSSFDYTKCRSKVCVGRKTTNIPIGKGLEYDHYVLMWDDRFTDIPSLNECSATLIDEQYLMTTASCVTSSKGHPKMVGHKYGFLSSHKLFLVSVKDVYVSPKYRQGSPENNIALIKMELIARTSQITPLCLWNTNIDGEWEAPQFGINFPERLETDTFVNVSQSERCDLNQPSGSDLVCFTNNIKNLIPGSCTVEHGGAVIHYNKEKNVLYAYGITSPLSEGCGSNLYMTDVTPHIDWMEDIIIHKRS